MVHSHATVPSPDAIVRRVHPPFGKYLSIAALDQLKAYKYVSAPLVSVCDRTLTPFWEFCVTLLPMWLAPNLVTTFSFLHAVLAHLLIQYYTPTLSEAAPNWVYIVVALCMFLYQTLDAIDGKQARRTKNGSPLGQLFDHGCDAVTSWIMGIFLAATLQCGPTFVAYLMVLMIIAPFFAANWEESCTGVMRFGIVGVTEGQLIVMGVELLTGFFGPQIWKIQLFPELLHVNILPSITLFHVATSCGIGGALFQILSSIWTVIGYYRTHPNEKAQQEATVAFVQYYLSLFLLTIWCLSPSYPILHHPRTVLVLVGALCSYQASRLIICHTTGEPYPKWFAILWPLPLLVLNEWSGRLFNGKDDELWFNQSTIINGYMLFTTVLYIHFVVVTIDQITTFLGIRCFKVKPVVPEAGIKTQ